VTAPRDEDDEDDEDVPRGRRHSGRIGLVLGAGGPVGHAYHAGALRALEHALGWDAREADVIVGTSAGAQVGALLRAGLHGADLATRVAGGPLRRAARAIAAHYVRPHTDVEPASPRRYVPAAPAYVARALRAPTLLRPGRLLAALLPEGRVRLDPLSAGFRNVFGERWPDRPLWVTSVQLDTGDPVAFGRAGAPAIDVGTAVACSAAVPGIFAPVEHGGLRYVDGGIASATHLELLVPEKLDLVIVSSPLSVFLPMRALLRREVAALEKTTPVAALEPTAEVAAAMGLNPMAVERGPDVARAAYEATLRAIETGALRERLRDAF
jgi:NTE family protein